MGTSENSSLAADQAAPDICSQSFRAVMGAFATGVTVVTAKNKHGGPAVGVTVNAFSSLSLDPPLVLICLDKETGCLECFLGRAGFVINILAADQGHVSNAFAGPQDADFHGYAFDAWETGAPVLRGVKAAIECRTETTHDGGDHMIVVGRVLRVETDADRAPLLYYQGSYRQLDHSGGV